VRSLWDNHMEAGTLEFDDEATQTLEALRAALAARDDELAAAQESNRRAAVRLRESLLAAEPALDPELVTGETVDEIDASFAAAKTLLERVREGVKKEQSARVPAGAPGRTAGTAALTPFEKIRAGLGGR
jgi:hypothetical protein